MGDSCSFDVETLERPVSSGYRPDECRADHVVHLLELGTGIESLSPRLLLQDLVHAFLQITVECLERVFEE